MEDRRVPAAIIKPRRIPQDAPVVSYSGRRASGRLLVTRKSLILGGVNGFNDDSRVVL